MDTRMRLKLATTGFFAVSTWALTAVAEEHPPCETFTLQSVQVENTAIDTGAQGESLGDERIGSRELADSDGNVVGKLRWVDTLVGVDEGSEGADFSLAASVYSLPGGNLYGQVLLEFTSANDPDEDPRSMMVAIVGGTGAYVRSEGQVEVSFEPGGANTYEFQLYCD